MLIVRSLIQHEGACDGLSSVAFRGHLVETCSLPICLSLCGYLWEQLIIISLDLFCKANYSNCLTIFKAFDTRMKHIRSLFECMETD